MARLSYSDLTGISAFVHAVETGSFTAAADRLGLSKSAIGKAVARLESHLGVRLLERTTRSLGLTADGHLYYQTCVRILADLEEAETALASSRRDVSGRLRIGLSISFGRLWVMPILLALAREHSKLNLDVSFTDRDVDLVEEGFDLVVRLGELGNQASLVGRRLGVQRAVVCASPDYIKAHGQPASIADLSDHDCLGFAREGRLAPWSLPDDTGAPIPVRVAARHIFGHGEAYREAVLAGTGLGYMVTWLAAEDIRRGRLIPVLPSKPFETVPIAALWPRSRDLSPKVRVAVDSLTRAFLPVPPWDAGLM